MAALRGKEAIGKITAVSELNYAKDVRAEMNLPKKVVINDLTLREGRQLEGLVVTPEECAYIALQLQDLGVPMVQLRVGRHHWDIMKAVGKLNLKMKTECLSVAYQQVPPFTVKVVKDDIDKCGEYNLGMCLVLAMANDLLLGIADLRGEKKRSVDYLKKQQIEMAVEAVHYSKKHGVPINTNMQDFLRCDFSYLKEICDALVKAGIDVITLDDIAGPALPNAYKYQVRKLKKAVPRATFGIHVHNDYGLALPAVLAALEGGCEVLDCGINGYGERAGHADLASLVVDLEYLYGFNTGIKVDQLTRVSGLVADIFRQTLPKSAPVVGQHAFSHCSDWHWQFPKYPWLVAALAPEAVGNTSHAIIGSYVGPYGITMKGEELGIKIPWAKTGEIISNIYDELRWRKRPLSDDEFREIVYKVIGNKKSR